MNTKQHLKKWLICPNTGRQKAGEPVTVYPIPGGWAVWWRCSICHRWHMIEIAAPSKNSSQLPWEDAPENGKDYFLNVQP